ncbi:hypothetical protein D3C73_902140 [compost metagenome]
MIHHQDQISILNGRETVGNDKACSAFHQLIHRLLNLNLCPRIDAARRFIKNEDGRVSQDCPGNGQQLLLTL